MTRRRTVKAVFCASFLSLLPACGSSHATPPPDASTIMFDATPDAGVDSGPDTGPLPAAGAIGASCAADTDCTGGICVQDPDFFPGGYCSQLCSDGEECPAGSVCTPIDADGTAICLDQCAPGSSSRECRMGYGCATFDVPEPICIGGCIDDSDCAAGRSCDPAGGQLGSGACFSPDAIVGDACTGDAECAADATCLAEDFGGWPGGSCVVPGCDPASGSGCTGGAVCIPLFRGGVCARGCTGDTECREGYRCATADSGGRYCAPGCTSDAQCASGHVCNTTLGTCNEPFTASDLGRVCARMFDVCVGGTCLRETQNGFPGSYCTYVGCAVGVPDAEDGCPGDGVCTSTRRGTTLCLDGCSGDGDCRLGYHCLPASPADPSSPTACVPACADDTQCPSDSTVCNEGTGLCAATFDAAREGATCLSAMDCLGGLCLSESLDGWPGGTCVALGCRLSGAGGAETCPTGSVCVDDAYGDPAIGYCLPSCSDATPCRSGYTCASGTCRPQCTASDCSAPRTCNTTSGLCE